MLAAVTGPGGRLVIERGRAGPRDRRQFPGDLARASSAPSARSMPQARGDGRGRRAADLRRSRPMVGAAGAGARRRAASRKGDRVGIAMRNCPSWVVAYMAIAQGGRGRDLAQRLVAEPRARARARPGRAEADHRRRAPRQADRGRLRRLARPRASTIEEPLDDGAGAAARRRRRGRDACPRSRPRTTRRSCSPRARPASPRARLSTHRAVTTGVYAYATGLMVLLGILTEESRAAGDPPRTLLNVPLFHVTGEVPVMLNSFVVGRGMVMMPKWDAGEALRLIEKEKITYFVGVPTMSLELMNHPDRDKYDLSSLTDITAGGAPRPVSHVERLQKEFPEGAAGARLRPDRDQRRRLLQLLGQLCRQARVDRPRRSSRSSRSPSSARATRICRRASAARSPSGPPPTSNAIGAIRTRPRRPSPPTATSAPATSAISTRTAICSSSTARRTSSSAAARTSPRPRSKPPLRLPRRRRSLRCSERPTSGSAKCRSRSSIRSEGSELDEAGLRAFLEAANRRVQDSGADHLLRRAAARLGTGKIDRVALKAKHAATDARSTAGPC